MICEAIRCRSQMVSRYSEVFGIKVRALGGFERVPEDGSGGKIVPNEEQ